MPPSIRNYPGFSEIAGFELMQKIQGQAEKSGVKIVFDEVEKIEEKNGFLVKTSTDEYEAKAVIVASGKIPRKLGASGEDKFAGKGVFYCVTCDLPMFKDKVIAIVGGGNSALDVVLYGSEVAKKVYMIHRRDEFRGFESTVRKIKERKNVEMFLNSNVSEIKGEKFVKSAVVQNLKTNEKKEIDVDGIFVEIGYEPNVGFVKGLVKLDEINQIITSKRCETFYPGNDKIKPGIFAAGDVTDNPFKQVVTSAAEGAKAALQAYNFIHEEFK
jgi:thioredoxin reductase (NADPH)